MGMNGQARTPSEIARIAGVPRWRVMYFIRSWYGWRQKGDPDYYMRWVLEPEQADFVLGHFVREGIARMGYDIIWRKRK
jgi:hypothetical protein